jgi:hypothetical protein
MNPIIQETEDWVNSFIVKLNICPFAKREIERKCVKFHVSVAKKTKQAQEELLNEFIYLDTHPKIETTLLIFPSMFRDFFQYLNFVDAAELLIKENNYEGVYQLATFHPQYCFADTDFDDISNKTNRSPYPMLHLLREASVEKAIAFYGDTSQISINNRATLLRELEVNNKMGC